MSDKSEKISPTAYYTGEVWRRNGLSHPALGTRAGARLYRSVAPANWAYRTFTGGPTLEDMLLHRHLAMDALVDRAVEHQGVRQIVEIASGLSLRGSRMVRRHESAGLVYLEGDLERMAARKRDVLARAELEHPALSVHTIDALLDGGDKSLAALSGQLDPHLPTLVLTEGLVNYLTPEDAVGMWQRVATLLSKFPSCSYISDIHLEDDVRALWIARVFAKCLSAFTSGQVYFHYRTAEQCTAALEEAGFQSAALHGLEALSPPDTPWTHADIVRIVEASPHAA